MCTGMATRCGILSYLIYLTRCGAGAPWDPLGGVRVGLGHRCAAAWVRVRRRLVTRRPHGFSGEAARFPIYLSILGFARRKVS